MRTYGRIYNTDGTYKWVEVSTAPNGDNSDVYTTTLIQCLKLVLGESPFYANYGLPQILSIIQQIFPDYYVAQTQTQFAQFFTSLIISRLPTEEPTYNVRAITLQGSVIQFGVKVPQ